MLLAHVGLSLLSHLGLIGLVFLVFSRLGSRQPRFMTALLFLWTDCARAWADAAVLSRWTWLPSVSDCPTWNLTRVRVGDVIYSESKGGIWPFQCSLSIQKKTKKDIEVLFFSIPDMGNSLVIAAVVERQHLQGGESKTSVAKDSKAKCTKFPTRTFEDHVCIMCNMKNAATKTDKSDSWYVSALGFQTVRRSIHPSFPLSSYYVQLLGGWRGVAGQRRHSPSIVFWVSPGRRSDTKEEHLYVELWLLLLFLHFHVTALFKSGLN